MSTRVTRQTVHFHHAFPLPEREEPLPAGCYEVEFEEERIDGLSFIAWRTVRATLNRIEPINGLSFAIDVGAEGVKAAIVRNSAPTQSVSAKVPTRAATHGADQVDPVAELSSERRDLIVPPVIRPSGGGVTAIAAFILKLFR